MHHKIVTSFYKYIKLNDPLKLQQEQLELCRKLNLKGRIMIGHEGINGCIYGKKDAILKYKQELRKNKLFSDIEFKNNIACKPAYRKLFVRLRKEIVYSGLKVDLKNKGEYITPSELKELLDKNEDIVLVDMRNDYETQIGRFKNSLILDMKNFRDLSKTFDKIQSLRDKKIITYCTGGIRCEKASALLKENGFENVYQLKGGILKYGEEFPDTYWQGKLFVFDDRLAISINKHDNEPLTECVWCKIKVDQYLNCHNIDCDKLFICCDECKEKHNKSCSMECEKAEKRRKEHLILFE